MTAMMLSMMFQRRRHAPIKPVFAPVLSSPASQANGYPVRHQIMVPIMSPVKQPAMVWTMTVMGPMTKCARVPRV
jgi:hypothetical protein